MAGARRPGLLVRQRRSSLDAGQVDDALLQRLWAVVGRLHTLRIALGNLSADGLVVRPDGSPALGDFGQATMAAGDAGLMADRAQLLVTTALLVGGEPAVAAAAASIGSAGLTEMLPFVQPAVLDRATRRMVRAGAWEVDDLRELAADAAGVDPPKLEQIRRVTWGSIAIAAVLGSPPTPSSRRLPESGSRISSTSSPRPTPHCSGERCCFLRSSRSARHSRRWGRPSGPCAWGPRSSSSTPSSSSRWRSPARRPGSRWRSASSSASVPRIRAVVRGRVADLAVALQALRSPSKVALIFLGNLAAQILLAAILGLCLDASGSMRTWPT